MHKKERKPTLFDRHQECLKLIKLQQSLMTEDEVLAVYENLQYNKSYPKFLDDNQLHNVLELKRLLLVRKGIYMEAKQEAPECKKGFFTAIKDWYLKPLREAEDEPVELFDETFAKQIDESWTTPAGYRVSLDDYGIPRKVVE